MLLHLSFLLGVNSLAFNYVCWRALEIYTSSDSRTHSYHGTHDRTSNRTYNRPTRGISRNPIALSFNSLSTVALILQQSHIDARYIARFNLLTSHNASVEFRTNTFSSAILSATVYYSYLIFFVCTIILSLLIVHQLWKGLYNKC